MQVGFPVLLARCAREVWSRVSSVLALLSIDMADIFYRLQRSLPVSVVEARYGCSLDKEQEYGKVGHMWKIEIDENLNAVTRNFVVDR